MPKISNRFLKYFIILLLVVPSIFSCSVHKRYYRKGYTIIWKKNDRVKVNHQRKNSIIERTSSNKKTVLAQRESVQMSSENREVFSNEPEYLVKETEVFKNNENKIIDSKIKTNSQLKLKSVLLSKITKITSEKALTSSTASLKITKINSDKSKPSYFETSESLWAAFLGTLLAGLIVLLIGIVVENAVILIIGNIIIIISGLILLIVLMSIFLCIVTLGMIC
jgi:hypothetical protein